VTPEKPKHAACLSVVVPAYNEEATLAAAVKFYDDFCVPVLRRVEAIVAPPLGKNVLLVAEKT
jgi:hypothetical protein